LAVFLIAFLVERFKIYEGKITGNLDFPQRNQNIIGKMYQFSFVEIYFHHILK